MNQLGLIRLMATVHQDEWDGNFMIWERLIILKFWMKPLRLGVTISEGIKECPKSFVKFNDIYILWKDIRI